MIGGLFLFAFLAPGVWAQTYTVTNLDFTPKAINNRGDVVGITGGMPNHAILYTGGKLIDLGTLGAAGSAIAAGINDSGQIVGWAYPASGPERSFLYSGGILTDLGISGCDANSINNSGQIVGSCGFGGFLYSSGSLLQSWSEFSANAINNVGQVAGTDLGAFLYSGGTMVSLGTFGGYATAEGINDSGQVVGCAVTADSQYGPLFTAAGV